MIDSKEHLPSLWPSSTPGTSNGIAPISFAVPLIFFSAVKMKVAWLSMNLVMSQGQATLSTCTWDLVIHFILALPALVWVDFQRLRQ